MVIEDGVAMLTRKELLRYAKDVYRSGKSPEARGAGLAVLTLARLLADAEARSKAQRRALDDIAALAGRLALGAAEIARRTSDAEADADNATALAAGEETDHEPR